MKKNNIIAIGIVFFVGLLLLIFSIKSSNKVNNYKLLEAPVHINSINVSIRISNEDNNLKSVITYENNSSNDISSMVIDVKLKDEDKLVSYELNELVKAGDVSPTFYGESPKSGNDEDIEILKYKVSLKNGTYMEYDKITNIYNWS